MPSSSSSYIVTNTDEDVTSSYNWDRLTDVSIEWYEVPKPTLSERYKSKKLKISGLVKFLEKTKCITQK